MNSKPESRRVDGELTKVWRDKKMHTNQILLKGGDLGVKKYKKKKLTWPSMEIKLNQKTDFEGYMLGKPHYITCSIEQLYKNLYMHFGLENRC
jgi:hypothetical protein